MDEKRYQENIARNIAHYRKRANMTQAQLADKILYSDKAVSKWERGEGIPDVLVLLRLAEIFNVTINDLICDKPKKESPYFFRNRFLITILSCLLSWLVAVIVFVFGNIIWPQAHHMWLVFIYAIVVSCIVFVVFSMLWWNKTVKFIAVSFLIWACCLGMYLPIHLFTGVGYDWMIFLIGIPLEVLFIFFFLLKKRQKNL